MLGYDYGFLSHICTIHAIGMDYKLLIICILGADSLVGQFRTAGTCILRRTMNLNHFATSIAYCRDSCTVTYF
jgi:hypothetical protein